MTMPGTIWVISVPNTIVREPRSPNRASPYAAGAEISRQMATAPSDTASEVSRCPPWSLMAFEKPDRSRLPGTGSTFSSPDSGCSAVLSIQYSGNSITARTSTPATVEPQRRRDALGVWVAIVGHFPSVRLARR